MAMSNVSTQVFTTKLFKWDIPCFNQLNRNNMTSASEKVSRRTSVNYKFIESPQMTAVNPFNGLKYTATFKLKIYRENRDVKIDGDFSFYFSDGFIMYYQINDDPNKQYFNGCRSATFPWNENIEKLTVFVDMTGTKNFEISPFKRITNSTVIDRMKEIWKNDSSIKVTIKCGEISIDTYKPILVASSIFFKDMFETVTENIIEIEDFHPKIVQKMVEFCETNNVADTNGYEKSLFEIAHKYQMKEFIEFAVEKMSENASASNISYFLKIAMDYKLEDFEKWCIEFAFLHKINIK